MRHLGVVLRPSWRPGALGAIQGSLKPSRGLGQAYTNNLMVEVVDQAGKPIKGIPVEFSGQTVLTDSKGLAGFSAMGSGPFDVKATYDALTIGKAVSADEISKGYTTFLQFPICVVDSLIRPIDFAIFGVAGGMIAAGSYWKIKPLEMTGEIALGAAIFGFIYRLSCL